MKLPTPKWSDRRVARLAATRCYLNHPSADDVMMAACPRYHEYDGKRYHPDTERWHRIKCILETLVDLGREVDPRPGPVKRGPTKPHPNGDWKRCRHCGGRFQQSTSESRSQFGRRKYCSQTCNNRHRAAQRTSLTPDKLAEAWRLRREHGLSFPALSRALHVPASTLWAAMTRGSRRAA